VNQPLAQRILDIIYRDSEVRRTHKESLTDWILDTQPRTAPLSTVSLLDYLGAHQPDVLKRLKMNPRVQDQLTLLEPGSPN